MKTDIVILSRNDELAAKLAKYWAQNAAAILKALAKKPAVYSRYEGRNA